MAEKQLNATEAAIRLGITKELLYAYVKNAPKKHLGEKRKLKTILQDGKNLFEEKEIAEFDNYLKKPWSKPKSKRPPIPKYIQEYLKTEIGGKCPITSKGAPLENAHIIDYAKSRSHHHHNLIRISQELHSKFDSGIASKSILKKVKDRLVAELRSSLRTESKAYNATFRYPSPQFPLLGRDSDLDDLLHALRDERLIIIQGIGGIGKTHLLQHALEKEHDDIATIWLELENCNQVTDLEMELHQALNNIGIIDNNRPLVDQLNDLNIRIVFDGLERLLIDQRDDTLRFITDLSCLTHQPQYIITSQIDLSTIDVNKITIPLNGISPTHGYMLIEEIVSKTFSLRDREINPLIEFCEGHPLALKLVGALLVFYGNIPSAAKHIKHHKAIAHPLREEHDKTSSLEVCLATVYSCLGASPKKLLKYFVCFPAGCKILWVNSEVQSKDFEQDIALLKQFFLIQIKEDPLGLERAYVLNPIREFIHLEGRKENAKEAIQIQRKAINSIMMESMIISHKYLELSEYGPPEYGILRLESELPNLLEAFRTTAWGIENGTEFDESPKEYLTIRALLAGSMGKYFFTRGFYQYGAIFSKAGVDANLKLKRYGSAAIQYMYLAQLQLRQYNLEGLEKTANSLIRLAKESNHIDAKIYAEWSSGLLKLEKKNFEQALIHFQNAKALLEESLVQTFEDYRNSIDEELTIEITKDSEESVQKSNVDLEDYEQSKKLTSGNLSNITAEIAKVYEFSNRFAEAKQYYLEAIELQQEIGDNTNLPSLQHHLGNCYCGMNDIDKGVDMYYKAIQGFSRFGQYEYLGNSIYELGRFVVGRLDIVRNEILEENMLRQTLENLGYEIASFIKTMKQKGLKNAIRHIPWNLLSKATLMMQLISFTKNSHLLFDWAEELSSALDMRNADLSYFAALLNVAHIVGGVGYGHHHSPAKKQMLKFLKQGVLIINGGPDLKSQTFIFYWLSAWLRFTGLDPDANAEKLIKEASQS